MGSKFIPGKLRTEDIDQLVELVKDKCVFQLGCYCGRGTLVLAQHAAKVWVLEDFKHPEGVEGVIAELISNINRYAPEDKVINLLYGNAESWVVSPGSEDLQYDSVDVVYRDSNRSELERDNDEQLALALLKRYGGVYIWHNENRSLKWLQVQPTPVEVN